MFARYAGYPPDCPGLDRGGKMARLSGKRRARAMVIIATFLLLSLFVFWGTMRQTRSLMRGFSLGTRDFCDYLDLDAEGRQTYGHDKYQRPIVDFRNNLYICVSPKAGITKVQNEFLSFDERQTGTRQERGSLNGIFDAFTEKVGASAESINQSNFTKIFVYRNPVDRFISLYLDKFSPGRYHHAWVSQVFADDFHLPSMDLLLKYLDFYARHSQDDPHIWPQSEYCRVDDIKYDFEVDIDDRSMLSQIFSKFWGQEVDFEGSTPHATKEKFGTDIRDQYRDKIHLWRKSFTQTYWRDIEYYCRRRNMESYSNRTL